MRAGRGTQGPQPDAPHPHPLQAGSDPRQPVGEAGVPEGERGEDLVRPGRGGAAGPERAGGGAGGGGRWMAWARLWGCALAQW